MVLNRRFKRGWAHFSRTRSGEGDKLLDAKLRDEIRDEPTQPPIVGALRVRGEQCIKCSVGRHIRRPTITKVDSDAFLKWWERPLAHTMNNLMLADWL